MSVARLDLENRERMPWGMNPKKFLMWIFLVTIMMLFAALTSAVVVRRAAGNWMYFEMPITFYISTAIIVLSSVSMQWAYVSAKKDEILDNRRALWITLLLGCVFIGAQIMGYKALINEHVYLAGGQTSASFFYAISGLHALHVVGGIFLLFATLIKSYRYKVHSRNMLAINLCTTYWHFIGGLWVYLFAVLTLLR